jgi:thymidylate synthase (FAD)
MAKLVWATPKGDELIAYMARVSNPSAQLGDPSEKLIAYLLRHGHYSPFEMVNCVVEIETTRDISRQILRHRSFTFQEFSGRYAAYDELRTVRECRTQHPTNRQASLDSEDEELSKWWAESVTAIADNAGVVYAMALERGVAKEVARAVLPEGLVPTRMYMNGTLRSWIHYFQARCTEGTQKEHRQLAESLRSLVLAQFPQVQKALDDRV